MKLKFAPFCSSRNALSDGILFLLKSKFSDFGQKPWTITHGFFFWESEKSSEKSIPPYRKRKQKSNDACFSRIAPSSGEL